MMTSGVAVFYGAGFHPQVLVQGCQLDKTDLDEFLHHIYQQLRTLENNIAQVLHQHHKQVCVRLTPWARVRLGLALGLASVFGCSFGCEANTFASCTVLFFSADLPLKVSSGKVNSHRRCLTFVDQLNCLKYIYNASKFTVNGLLIMYVL